MAENESLHQAKTAKKDEFYTQMSDINAELKHYKKHFNGQTVYCNCDDPYESNFFKYFTECFRMLGLKRLIATSYADSIIAGTQLSLFETAEGENITRKTPYKADIHGVGDMNLDGAYNEVDVQIILKNMSNAVTKLEKDGAFDSPECLKLLEEADIVVTNPPFSRFRDYVSLLMKYNKKFLIIGNQNAITYKEIFPLIKENKMWLGYKFGDMAFTVPDTYEPRETRYWMDETGQKWRSMGNICWFTNLDHDKRHYPMKLVESYKPEKYPKYDNYDAINVDKTSDIPCDYYGVMGVPLTFLDKYCPDQFEILDGIGRYSALTGPTDETQGKYLTNVNGEHKYFRIIIRRKQQ